MFATWLYSKPDSKKKKEVAYIPLTNTKVDDDDAERLSEDELGIAGRSNGDSAGRSTTPPVNPKRHD